VRVFWYSKQENYWFLTSKYKGKKINLETEAGSHPRSDDLKVGMQAIPPGFSFFVESRTVFELLQYANSANRMKR
jgi:hypothetical protein